MTTAPSRKWIVISAMLVVGGAVALFFWSRSGTKPPKNAVTPGTQPPVAANPQQNPAAQVPAMVSALAYLDLHGADLPPEKTIADYSRELGADPEHMMQELDKRIALVPYEGSLKEPVRLLQSGVSNSLDRARLVQMLLKSAGTESRIVFANQDGKTVSARYATSNPASLPVMKPEMLDELRKTVDDLTPRITAKLKSSAAGNNFSAVKAERKLYWVQYQRSGAWTDLVSSDTTIEPARRASAQVLSDSAVPALTWQVSLKVLNTSGHKAQEVLSFSAPAAELSAEPLTILNQPEGSLTKFVPRLLYADRNVSGQNFELKPDGSGLDYQQLKIDVTGPYEQRHFVRTLVFPKGPANAAERGLEVATAARVTVVCGPVSEEEFQRRVIANLTQAGKVLFRKTQQQDAAPLNLPSIPGIAVLDASQRYAGHSGAAAQLLAFQGRPAVAVEHDYVQTTETAMVRRHSFDLVDPGHALYAVNASPESLMNAAIEQSVVDAWMEDRVTGGDSAITSLKSIRSLLSTDAAVNLRKPPSALESDNYGNLRPAYRLGQTNQIVAGWRFDPGPQVVPLLGNLTGGTLSDMEQRARVASFCKGVGWVTMAVPAGYFPQKFLFSSIVTYDCKLAETYNKVTDALSNAFAPMEGGADSGKGNDDLKKQIEGLGPGLIENTVKNAVKQTIGGMVIEGVKHYLSPAAESAARPFSAGDQNPGAIDSAVASVGRSLQPGTSIEAIEQTAARALPQ
jgi:hypothetical protein